MSKAEAFIRGIPVQICGLALAMASLDSLLRRWYGHSHGVFAIVSALLIILFTIRAVADRQGIRKDLENPAVLGVAPTYGMAVMLLCARFSEYANISKTIWSAALIMNLLLMAIFFKRFVTDFKMTNVYPAWFVVFVGLAVASVSSPSMGMITAGRMIFWFTLLCYAALLPIVIFRVIRFPVPSAAIPGIAIFAAPANLCIAGYFSVYDQTIPELVIILAAVGLASYAAVMIYMPKILRTAFNPNLSAITFPLVISAVSFHILADHYGISSNILASHVLIITAAAALIAVCYVTVRYIMFLCTRMKG